LVTLVYEANQVSPWECQVRANSKYRYRLESQGD
jgi:hypothetical protein